MTYSESFVWGCVALAMASGVVVGVLAAAMWKGGDE